MSTLVTTLLFASLATAHSISAHSHLDSNGTDKRLSRSTFVTLDVDQALHRLFAENVEFEREEKLAEETYTEELLPAFWEPDHRFSKKHSSNGYENTHSVRSREAVVEHRSRLSARQSELQQCFKTHAIIETYMPGEKDYNYRAQIGRNALFAGNPTAVVMAYKTEDVQSAVICAKAAGLPVQPRAGGHSYAQFGSGYAAGGKNPVVIDISRLNSIAYNSAQETFAVGGGVLLGNLALSLLDKGRAMSHGSCPSVGLAGHALNGGVGYTSRMWGLSTDFIIGMDVVIANGEVISASEEEKSDLFHAMRGAGSSFGIAVKFELRTAPAPKKVVKFDYDAMYSDPTDGAYSFLDITRCVQSDNFNEKYTISGWINPEGGDTLEIQGWFFGEQSEFDTAVHECFVNAMLPGLHTSYFGEFSFSEYLENIKGSVPLREPATGYGFANSPPDGYLSKTVMLSENNMPGIDTLTRYFEQCTDSSLRSSVCSFRLLGGKQSQVPHEGSSTAISWRDTLWVMTLSGTGNQAATFHQMYRTLADTSDGQSRYGLQSFVDGSLSREEAHKAYYSSEELTKLQEIKARYDPHNLFRNPHSIEPQP